MSRNVIVRRSLGMLLLVLTLGLTNCKALLGAFTAGATVAPASIDLVRHA